MADAMTPDAAAEPRRFDREALRAEAVAELGRQNTAIEALRTEKAAIQAKIREAVIVRDELESTIRGLTIKTRPGRRHADPAQTSLPETTTTDQEGSDDQ